jgi:ABC-type multidrug transport system fused ATPase/permease subunit
MNAARPRASLRCLARIALGRRGAALLTLSGLTSLAQALVEWGVAAFLLLFLHSLALVDAAAMPRWLPLDPERAGPLAVWGLLLALAAAKSLLDVVGYESKILAVERAHARLRMVLGFRILRAETLPPMPLSRMNHFTAEIFPRATSFLFHSVQLGSFAVQAAMLALAMLYLAPGEAVVGLVGLVVLAALVLQFNRLNNRFAEALAGIHASFEQSKVRIARNWLFIRALRLERLEHRRYLDACLRYYRHSVLAYFFGNLGGALAPLVAVVVMAAVVLARFWFFHTTTANLIAFLYLFFRFQQTLANGSQLIGGLFTFAGHVREAASLIDELSPHELRRALAPDRAASGLGAALSPASLPDASGAAPEVEAGPTPDKPPSLTVEGLAFAWPDDPAPLFEGLSFSIPGGAQLGIVGQNGAGKSTFLAILLGSLRASAGVVRLDEIESAEYVSRHHTAVGYVGPEPYLVQGTLRENLLYGSQRASSDAEIWQVLEEVRLSARVSSLPRGLEHEVQESGEGLSAGEKQKLGIARAILRRPRLLVLDEPTANVDEQSERDIAALLFRLRGWCTVVAVSHKPAMLRHADRTLAFDKGQPSCFPIHVETTLSR